MHESARCDLSGIPHKAKAQILDISDDFRLAAVVKIILHFE